MKLNSFLVGKIVNGMGMLIGGVCCVLESGNYHVDAVFSDAEFLNGYIHGREIKINGVADCNIPVYDEHMRCKSNVYFVLGYACNGGNKKWYIVLQNHKFGLLSISSANRIRNSGGLVCPKKKFLAPMEKVSALRMIGSGEKGDALSEYMVAEVATLRLEHKYDKYKFRVSGYSDYFSVEFGKLFYYCDFRGDSPINATVNLCGLGEVSVYCRSSSGVRGGTVCLFGDNLYISELPNVMCVRVKAVQMELNGGAVGVGTKELRLSGGIKVDSLAFYNSFIDKVFVSGSFDCSCGHLKNHNGKEVQIIEF